MIKCLLSRPGLISGPLKPQPELILTQFQGLTLSTPSLVSSINILNKWTFINKIIIITYKNKNQFIDFQGPTSICSW